MLVIGVWACGDTGTSDNGSGSGGSGGAEPRGSNWVYCDNPEAAAPSCNLPGFAVGDDAALRAKLETCTQSVCHSGGPTGATTWMLDLSGSVEAGLSALQHFADSSPFFLVDAADPDCSQVLAQVSTRPFNAVRMPVSGGYWSNDEVECFRSYLHEITN